MKISNHILSIIFTIWTALFAGCEVERKTSNENTEVKPCRSRIHLETHPTGGQIGDTLQVIFQETGCSSETLTFPVFAIGVQDPGVKIIDFGVQDTHAGKGRILIAADPDTLKKAPRIFFYSILESQPPDTLIKGSIVLRKRNGQYRFVLSSLDRKPDDHSKSENE